MKERQDEKKLVWPLYVVVGCVLVFIGFYAANFMNGPISSDTGDWGTFGDYVGGLANPIVALAVLFYVYNTFKLQRKELNATKSEMKKQTKIQKFTSLINIKQNELSNSIAHTRRLENRMDINSEYMIKNNKKLMEAMESGDDELKGVYHDTHEDLSLSNKGYLELMNESVKKINLLESKIEQLEKNLNAII